MISVSSLLENWFSAALDFSNEHPELVAALKKMFLVVFVGGITLASGLLGKKVGLFSKSSDKAPKFRHEDSHVDDDAERITIAINRVSATMY